MKIALATVTFCYLCFRIVFVPRAARAQTFEINGQQQSSSAAESPDKPGAKEKSKTAQSSSRGSGWGSSIEVGRTARAAEDALKLGNAAAAAEDAQRAVQAAPQNADLWFLLGYTSRLAGHFQQSLEAYRRGLAAHPNSAERRYDNVQSGFLISYLKPWWRTLQDATGQVPVEYPLRFSCGITTDDFFNFAGRGQTLVRPVVRLTLY